LGVFTTIYIHNEPTPIFGKAFLDVLNESSWVCHVMKNIMGVDKAKLAIGVVEIGTIAYGSVCYVTDGNVCDLFLEDALFQESNGSWG
jgi:hypothetical protein